MKRNLWLLLGGLLLLCQSSQSFALDPTTAQSYCNAVTTAAQNAQTQRIQVYTPQQDPQLTFNNATLSCMGTIANFTVPVPPSIQAMQPILQAVAKQILLQACQAASSEFQSAVSRALQTVTQPVQQIGVSVNTNTGTVSAGGVSLGNPVGTVVNSVGGTP
jgi:hypothetical protein